MKIPALRIKMGIWKYYVSYLSFEQINKFVKKIDDELHKSVTLRDLIQRSITKNYLDIKEYILTQNERFFNSLVLAVYDGEPKWIEVEINFKEKEYFNMGFLEFTGDEKIFPVDGQHRVEGIKEALKEKQTLKNENIAVIFIGHRKNNVGMERSRRLFTTLNRYAKPVTWDDIIALDEDDSSAIVTRELLERHELFSNKRIIKAKQKAIPDYDKNAFTSIITLYQCNRELLKSYLREKKQKDKGFKVKSFKNFLKFRPKQEILIEFERYTFKFWDDFVENLAFIKEYLKLPEKDPAKKFRNRETGGNILFRPVGLLPFIQALLLIQKRKNLSFSKILAKTDIFNFDLNSIPWKYILWNPKESKMIMGSNEVVKLLILFLFDKKLLLNNEMNKLKEGYAARIAYKGKAQNVLKLIK